MSEPRFGRLPDAKRRSGTSRSKLYQLAAKHDGLFRKLDDVTIVDLQMLDDILAALPPAKITTKAHDDEPLPTPAQGESEGASHA